MGQLAPKIAFDVDVSVNRPICIEILNLKKSGNNPIC